MVEQVLEFLRPASLKIYCDLTIGEGGHAEAILASSSPYGKLIGIDRDAQALLVAEKRLVGSFAGRFELIHSTFSDVRQHLQSRGLAGVDGMLADFGFSSFQIDDPGRGFSFLADGPLDMRMDGDRGITARDIVNRRGAQDLARILFELGNERHARRIAGAIAERARRRPFETTADLADVVRRAAGRSRTGRIDAATRTFQALRMSVNDETGQISALMSGVMDMLNPGGVFVAVAYHSLEDGIVKRALLAARRSAGAEVLTRKPLRPGAAEISENPRARSARLRAVRKPEQPDG
jgi:16S rRNA (cytosine1402-N4)-methyltransferase